MEYMEKISVAQMRRAILHVSRGDVQVRNLSDDQLLKCDWLNDLKMGNIRVCNVAIELQRSYNLSFPSEIFKVTRDNTVGALLDAINQYIDENANS